jgi:ribosomal protein S18 acetylase RimI-like enzyme
MSIIIRTATLADLEALAALNRAAYPEFVQDGVVFDTELLRAHQLQFPQGQLVAELDGEIVGAIATMIPPRALDPLAHHTWLGITDSATFARHDPGGDTLYLADIYVHSRAWGAGVGRALYAALFALCRKLGLANVVGGGRLYDYVDAPESVSPADYVAQVVRGERRDRVLISQLRAGFEVRGLLPGYLHDWRSRHVATLIVWDNPDRLLGRAGVGLGGRDLVGVRAGHDLHGLDVSGRRR